MEVLKLFNIKQPILLLKTLADNRLAIIDSMNAVRIVDTEKYAVVAGFKSSIQHDRLVGSHVDITPDASYSVSTVPGTNKAALFSVAKKAVVYRLGRHQGEIESVGIDPNGRYCVTCGQDGKVFVWVLKTARLAYAMPPHSDFVTTVAFNDSGQWVATGSFDRTIQVLNLGIMKQPLKLRGHGSVIIKTFFLPEVKLLSVEREGGVIVWDLRSGKIIKRLTKMNDEVTTMTLSSDKRFAFVATKLGYIALYDLQIMEQIASRYIKESEMITSLAFLTDPHRLAVGTSEGNVRVYALFGDEEEYMELLRKRQYKTFYDVVERNPLLLYSKSYETAERIWADIVAKARALLEKHERAKAKELLVTFAGIPKKNTFISQMLRDYEKYAQFQTYVKEGRFPLAYSLAKQYSAFQDSEPYRQMELRWKKVFAKAQELILGSNGEEQARALLAPYRGISEKTVLIQQLFEQRRMYEYFKKVIAHRDYVKFFDLVKRHPFLKEFAEYTAVMDYADKLYVQAQKGYVSGEYTTAKKACEILLSFPDYAQEAQQMSEAIKVKHLFYDAIASSNLLNGYAYLNAYPLLYDTPEAQMLERQWNAIVDQAQKYAAKGRASEIAEMFEPYRNVQEKYAAMGAVVAQAYCVQLEEKLRSKAPQSLIENGILRYVEFFGIDEGIMSVFNYAVKHYGSTLDLETLKQGSLETWTPQMLVDDITAL